MREFPEQLLNKLRQQPAFDTAAFLQAHEPSHRVTSLRLNPFKAASLDFDLGDAVPWCRQAYYLAERPSFTHDPLFHTGTYYVQEAGSMFLDHAMRSVLNLDQDLKILDVCAAPGGKSTVLNSMLSAQSLLVSNEFVKSRADLLAYQLSKWGTTNTLVTNNDPERFSLLPGFFDALVIDAPCSGSGLFRKQPEAIDEWSESSVMACALRQKKILTDVLPGLKENGVLFYSTCSFSEEENEDIVSWMLQNFDLELLEVPLNKAWGILPTQNGYRFYPHLTRSEGFFCSLLRKKSSGQQPYFKMMAEEKISKEEQSMLNGFLTAGDNSILKKNAQFHLMNFAVKEFLLMFSKQLYFKKAGVVAGELKGKDFVPNHELALCSELKAKVNRCELTREQSLLYLRKDNLVLADQDKGLALMCYKGTGLGWAKILPNRINNYLPTELRILK